LPSRSVEKTMSGGSVGVCVGVAEERAGGVNGGSEKFLRHAGRIARMESAKASHKGHFIGPPEDGFMIIPRKVRFNIIRARRWADKHWA
jgi:hypothetical protein